MKRLLVDKGNTRLKWKFLAVSNVWDQSKVLYGSLRDFEEWLQAQDFGNVLVDVSAVNDAASLSALLQRYDISDIRMHASEEDRLGLINSYEYPERMGVDRWLAMLGAREQLVRASFILIDAGTAFTLDVVKEGVHQGGYILPGILMAQNALYGNTDRVQRYQEQQVDNVDHVLGNNTLQCVEYGVLNQLLAIVRQVQQDFSGLPLILTGGDSSQLAPFLGDCEVDAELVLKGLFVIGKE